MIPVLHGETVSRRQYWGQGRPDITGTLDAAGAAWVAAATQGAEFHSTTGDQGAQVWVKTASGWIVTVGDTRPRWLDETYIVSSIGGTATVQRINGLVYINGSATGTVPYGTTFMNVPTGFQAVNGASFNVGGLLKGTGYNYTTAFTANDATFDSRIGGSVKFGGIAVGTGTHNFAAVVQTVQPWPTTYPGSPVIE